MPKLEKSKVHSVTFSYEQWEFVQWMLSKGYFLSLSDFIRTLVNNFILEKDKLREDYEKSHKLSPSFKKEIGILRTLQDLIEESGLTDDEYFKKYIEPCYKHD